MSIMLDKKGTVTSILMGLIILVLGGTEYFILLLSFFAISTLVTRYGEKEKKEMGIYEYERGWENVMSNGLVPVCFAIVHSLFGPLPFITSVAAVTADKFASELGVLGKKPIFLFSFKEVRPGTSGSISMLGTVMSFAGSVFIGAIGIILFGINPTTALWIGLGGFIGSAMDTFAGVLEEKRIGNKATSNFICSFTGGVFGIWLGSNL